MSPSPQESAEALARDVLVEIRPVGVERVRGPDATGFLQGQVSQDIEPLAPGQSTEALLLSPQGKLDALVRVVRAGDDAWLVVADADLSTVVDERLRRFKIRVRIELDPLRFSEIRLLAALPAGRAARRAADLAARLEGEHYLVDLGWPGVEAVGVLAPPEILAPATGALRPGDPGVIEAARIRAGIPGRAELDERTIPEEAGLVERTVSFTKGCYTGQELVARLDARGSNVARRLRLVEIAAPARPAPGDVLVAGGSRRGELTSVAVAPEGSVALGYFHRSVAPPATVELTGAAGTYRAAVLELPTPA